MKPLTPEKAIEHYTELQRRVSVGAYLELEHDGSFPPDDGSPESTTLESISNLEKWAEKQGLEFCWNHDSKTWSLVPIEQESELPPGDDIESIEQHIQEINEQEKNDWSGNDWSEGDEEEIEGDGSHLHQCPYCYNVVSEEHEEFCALSPYRNREIVP